MGDHKYEREIKGRGDASTRTGGVKKEMSEVQRRQKEVSIMQLEQERS